MIVSSSGLWSTDSSFATRGSLARSQLEEIGLARQRFHVRAVKRRPQGSQPVDDVEERLSSPRDFTSSKSSTTSAPKSTCHCFGAPATKKP